MATTPREDFLLQRWTTCLACGIHFDNVLYRCLHCSDFGSWHHTHGAHVTKGKLTASELPSRSQSSIAPSSIGTSTTGSNHKEEWLTTTSSERANEERNPDAFHVCPSCVRKASLFHPVRHTFVRVDIPWVVRTAGTSSSLKHTDETLPDYFDGPEARFLAIHACTFGRHRSKLVSAEDVGIWETFIHQRISSVPGVRGLKTISSKYHKQRCDRCKARIAGIRWERMCSPVPMDSASSSPTSTTTATTTTTAQTNASTDSSATARSTSSVSISSATSSPASITSSGVVTGQSNSSGLSKTPSGSLPLSDSASSGTAMRAYAHGDPNITYEEDHLLNNPFNIGSLGSMASLGSIATSIISGISNASGATPTSTTTSNTSSTSSGGSTSARNRKSASYLPGQTQAPFTRTMSLCILCFDTLHSDFASEPLGHKHIATPEHEDSYYKGYMWAHVRSLFDSATQPLNQTLADEEEALRADQHNHHHRHHHHHRSSTVTGDPTLIRSPSQVAPPDAPQTPSQWERRHIGSDQSIGAGSSSSGSGAYGLVESSSSSQKSNPVMKMVHLNHTAEGLNEWVLMNDPNDPSDDDGEDRDDEDDHDDDDSFDEEHMNGRSSQSSDSEDERVGSLFQVSANESLMDASTRQALKFLDADDVMRPLEIKEAIQPFIDSRKANADRKRAKAISNEEDEPQTSTLAEDGISIEEPEPVFELTAELRTELAQHKARSVFEYGLDRGFQGLPPISRLPPLSELPPLPPSMLSSATDPYGPAPSPYDAPKSRNVKSSTPPSYTNVSVSATPYSLPVPTSGYDAPSSAQQPIKSQPPQSGYVEPSSSPPRTSPYSAPSPDGQIGSTTPPYPQNDAKPAAVDAYGIPTAMKDTSTDSNAPYYSQGEVPREMPLSQEDLGRDWNAEWQLLLDDMRDQRLECLHLLVTEPAYGDDTHDHSIASLMNDAASLGPDSSLDCFISLLADEAEGAPPSDLSLRLAAIEAQLGELNSLKSDKNNPAAQMMLSIIRVKQFVKEFVGTANAIAKTIVSEVTLPIEGKTIKPKRMGGIAGGEKFLEQGIFFKFAIDAYKVYGGDKFAMKAASHEIQGLKAFAETETQGLCIPLSCIIDYSGYRVVASARLPISQDTLIYGSSDGGMTIHRKDPVFNEMMEAAAEQMNIKAHEVASGIVLHSAVDMEGHKGTDGRYYVLDTARVFPPEPPLRTFVAVVIPADTTSPHKWAPSIPICEMELIAQRSRWEEQVRTYLRTGHREYDDVHVNLIDGQVWHLDDPAASLPLNSRASSLVSRVVRGPAVYVIEPGQKSTQLFNLLRANHVVRQPHPLSSDAFTSFGRIDQDIHNTEVEDAFYRLLGIDIINFVKFITSRENFDLTHDHLITTIKNFGINFRLLGFLRSHIPIEPANKTLRSMLLVEMVTRVVKNDIRASLRSARRLSKNSDICVTPSICERQAHEIILSSFNLLLGNSTSSNFMWHSFIKTHLICKYGQYGQTLTEAELDANYDLRLEVNKLQLFQTLSAQLGVQFKDTVQLKFQRHPEFFEASSPFGTDDIESMVPKPKMLLQVKLHQFFQTNLLALGSVRQRMEAMRGFYGNKAHEVGYVALILAHVLNRFEKTTAKTGPLINLVFKTFRENPSATPAEVTCKAFYLRGTASMAEGNLELAEAQFKASYYIYRRSLSDYVAGRPMELGATFLLVVLDRLVRLMYQQNRKFEAWYYAQKFVRVWSSTPYPGDIKDLEAIMGRPTPWAFSLLWERDYYLGADRKLFLQHGAVTDAQGNIYSNSEDFLYERKNGTIARKTNLEDENLQELPELTPETRIRIEYELSHPKRASAQLAHHWRSTFKSVDNGNVSGYSMAGPVWEEWIESGAWKKERSMDMSVLRTAIWTPAVSLLYNKTIIRPSLHDPSFDDAHIVETHNGVPANSQLKSHPSGDIKHSYKTSISTPPNSSLDSLHSSGSAQQLLSLGSSSGKDAGPVSHISGTIRAPHVLRSGHISNFSFRWHVGREWSHEITGNEYFVLVRLEPSVWIVPSIVSGSKTVMEFMGKEGRRLLTGPLVGQFMEGEHEIVASMPARLLRTFGTESFYDLNLDYGFYQVFVITGNGQLWGRNTKKPCFVVSNQTIVLNAAVKSHVLRLNDQYNWLTSAMQAQGIRMTSLAAIPLGPRANMSYWVDDSKQLWYGFSDMASYVPKYLSQQYSVEEVHNFQVHPVIVPAPSDFAITFQQFALSLGSDISKFTNKASGTLASTASKISVSQQQQQLQQQLHHSRQASSGAHGSSSATSTPLSSTPSSHPPGSAMLERSPSSASAAAANSMMPYTLPDSPRSETNAPHGSDTLVASASKPTLLETSSTASTNSRSSSSVSSRAAAMLGEGFWKDEGGCKECTKENVSVVNFDSHGARILPGSTAVPANSVMSLTTVESQLSDYVMWTKMRKVPSLASEKVLKVVASNTHVMALLENGDVYTWGNNLYGELGHGDLVRIDEPRVVKRLRGKQVRDVACGVGRSVALLAGNRAVYQWGMDFSFFPEPHPFWKALPDEEVTKVIFQSQNGPGTPTQVQEWPTMPSIPREVASYGVFDPGHFSSSNSIWHSNIMLYLTDTGRVYLYGHDPHQIVFRMQKPALLDIFDNHPILDAVIGSNFIAFLAEKGMVYTTGHNELGQRGTGLVGDCEMTIDAALRAPLSSSGSGPVHFSPETTAHNANNKGPSPASKTSSTASSVDSKHSSAPTATSTTGNSGWEAVERYAKGHAKEVSGSEPLFSMSAARDSASSVSPSPASRHAPLNQARRGDGPHAGQERSHSATRRSGGHSSGSHSTFYDQHSSPSTSGSHSNLQNSHQRRAAEDERLGHAMNNATIPHVASKVTFPEKTQIAKMSVRGRKIYALATDGRVWHWGEGTYLPAIVEAMEEFIVVDVLAVAGGAAVFHTGPEPLPAQTLTERGRARRKALGLETPNCYDIRARQMLWTPSGLKPYVEGAPIPPKCHVIVTVDWKRPPSTMVDRGEQIRFVTPGHDSILGVPKAVSDISHPLMTLPSRQGSVAFDYLQPKIVRWSIDQGIASGQLNKHLDPLLEWAPLTDESRETLIRRREKRAETVRGWLVERQARLHAEARHLAEAKFAESRVSIDSTASGRSGHNGSNLGSGFGALGGTGSNSHSSTPGGHLFMNTSSGSAISVPSQQQQQSVPTSGTPPASAPAPIFERPALAHGKSRQSIREAASTSSLSSLQSSFTALTGGAAATTASSGTPVRGGSSINGANGANGPAWDPTQAFIEYESASSGVPASIDELTESSLSPELDPEEYAPMVPPGEYQVVYVITKPHFQILARSAPVKFTYEGIRASIEVENTTVVGDKPVTAHWKCELKLSGISIVAREIESGKIVQSEALRQRTSDAIRWKLPTGASYRLTIERTDANGITQLCESSVIESVSGANPGLSAFGNASMLAALSTMPSEVETCSEWSTFFKQCSLPTEFVMRYSSLLMASGIATTFIPAMDSGILEKLGITNLQHQVSIMTSIMKYREAHVRTIFTQELQKICESCTNGEVERYAASFNASTSSSFHSQ